MSQIATEATSPDVRKVFKSLGRAGRNVYSVTDLGLINIHVRSEDPGWWNILKTVKSDLDFLRMELHLGTYFVLLIGRNDRFIADGYVGIDFGSPPFVRHPGVEQTKYTVNERQHLDKSKRILSVERVAKALLKLRRKDEPV